MKHLRFFWLIVTVASIATNCVSPVRARAEVHDFRWAQKAGGTGRDYGTGIAMDSAGNSYVIGKFGSSNAVFGSFTLTNGGLFLAKYDTNGSVLWAKQSGSVATLTESFVAADRAGNAFLGGTFRNFFVFDGNTFSNGSPFTAYNFFLIKYNGAGNLVWARSSSTNGNTDYLRGGALTVDGQGNCYLTGDYSSAASLGLTNIPGPFGSGIGFFTAKFDTNGGLIWARTMGTTPLGSPKIGSSGIALGNSNDYYVCGQFFLSNAVFGNFTLTNAGNSDIFSARYDSNGNLLWLKHAGGPSYDITYGIGVDGASNCVISGFASTSIFFDDLVLTNGNNFLVKYDRNGNAVWCKAAGLFTNVNPFVQGLLRHTVDTAGNSYLIGTFLNTVAFDRIVMTNRNGDENYPSYFAAKWNAESLAVWGKQFGRADVEGDADASPKAGIAIDSAGNCSVTGFIVPINAQFDNFSLSSIGNRDIFVARFADLPQLQISRAGTSIALSWTTDYSDFTLEHAGSLLSPGGWSGITNSPVVIGGQYFITNSIFNEFQFFRLHKQ